LIALQFNEFTNEQNVEGLSSPCYAISDAISREIGDRRGEGARLGNLGLAYAYLGEVERAIEHY